jgi:DNA-binding transcriptional LysR family regulator
MSRAISSLRHLYALRAVRETGSVSAAARVLHLSQPALTQAITALEVEFGARFFHRTAQGMEPTEAGRICAERLARVLERLEAAVIATNPQVRRSSSAARGITASQLHALVTVIEAGGFGPAARSVGMTRATLHRAARELEKRMSVTLFETTSHGLRPTREALRLALQVQLATAELAQARAEVASLLGTERGETVIGAMPLARSRMVPEAILQFASRRPHHRISILDGPYDSLLDALRRGRADVLVGAMRGQVPADVVEEVLFEDPLAIIVRRGHPLERMTLGGRQAPPVEALAEYAWIAPRSGSPLRRHFDRLFRGATRDPPAAPVECNSLVAARGLLLSSDRAMLLSSQQVHHEITAGELIALPHPSGQVVRDIGFTLRKDWRPTAAQADFLETLRETATRSPRISR